MNLLSKPRKNHIRSLSLVLLILFCVGTGSFYLGRATSVSSAAQNEFRGVWVATVLSLNYPSKATTDPAVLKADLLKILDNAKDLGFNAVFFQVRPASDALYPSKIFPWSKYLTGTQGTAPANGFDPLAFMVEEAHARGLELHAWLNPYRITADPKDNQNLTADHPAQQHPAWVVTYTDGKMYWNPGEPGVQQLIADGVQEIVDNYAVDGIHIDDYFYPGRDFDDSICWSVYGGGYDSLEEWRLANTETTVRNMYQIVKNSGKDMVFGVSPMGIWANHATSNLGSNTRGGEALTQKYADTRGWVKREIMDYIAPQIYWNIGFEQAEYQTLVDWWSEVVAGTKVKLYIGQAAYRAGDADSSSPWYGVGEIQRQVEYNRSKPGVAGYIMYSYKSVVDNSALASLIQELNTEAPAPPTIDPPADPPVTSDPEVPIPEPLPDPEPIKPIFSDIAGHWAESYIVSMAEKGIISGDSTGKMLPNQPIKRADFVLMLSRMLGIAANGATDNFADVPRNAYYAETLATAKSLGLISGIGENKFDPEKPMTRQDLFALTYRALAQLGMLNETMGRPEALQSFSDHRLIAEYAITSMAVFTEQGIIVGSNGKVDPLKTATRAETATIMYNIDTKFTANNQ